MRVVIPPSPQQVCVICSDPTHPIQLFPSTVRKKLETLMHVVIPPSPQQVCVICSDPTHPIKLFPSTVRKNLKLLCVLLFLPPHTKFASFDLIQLIQ
jgi:hypothetical protein